MGVDVVGLAFHGPLVQGQPLDAVRQQSRQLLGPPQSQGPASWGVGKDALEPLGPRQEPRPMWLCPNLQPPARRHALCRGRHKLPCVKMSPRL